ncbi:hypothetical protein C8R47DRAFT_190576 [Mycena vitilis]|nr:hypothetical protein C8R47DRAFT_190576 [Mycena vitilis]
MVGLSSLFPTQLHPMPIRWSHRLSRISRPCRPPPLSRHRRRYWASSPRAERHNSKNSVHPLPAQLYPRLVALFDIKTVPASMSLHSQPPASTRPHCSAMSRMRSSPLHPRVSARFVPSLLRSLPLADTAIVLVIPLASKRGSAYLPEARPPRPFLASRTVLPRSSALLARFIVRTPTPISPPMRPRCLAMSRTRSSLPAQLHPRLAALFPLLASHARAARAVVLVLDIGIVPVSPRNSATSRTW